MALETTIPPPTLSAQHIGSKFVELYYSTFNSSPGMVHKFYKDSSVLSWPDSNGAMTSVTTRNGINEKILSLKYNEYQAEIKTVDAQQSYQGGVTLLVTGCLMGKDNFKKKFTQSFFLAPLDNRFFVLNDVFRFIEDEELFEKHSVHGVTDAMTVLSKQDPVEEETVKIDRAYATSDVKRQSRNGNDVPVLVERATTPHKDAPKKSYASIEKDAKEIPPPNQIFVPRDLLERIKATSKKSENNLPGSAQPASVPGASAPTTTYSLERNNTNDEVGTGNGRGGRSHDRGGFQSNIVRGGSQGRGPAGGDGWKRKNLSHI